jgi:hypothetical protein
MICASLVAASAGRTAAQPRQTPHDATRLAAAPTRAADPAEPADFVMAVESGRVELRSPSTGRLVTVVGRWGHDITNGGPVESANGKSLYVTLLVKRTLRIYRYSTVTGGRVRIATGDAPSLSPDGRYLAYATGRNGHLLAVRRLATGRTRVIDLAARLGTDFNLLNGGSTITWLGNNHRLAVVPGADGIATGTATGADRTCSDAENKQCIIVVDLRSDHAAGAARLETTSWFTGPVGAGPTPGTLLIGTLTKVGPAVERISIGARTARVEDTVVIRGATLAVGFDPSGRRLLYLTGHGPTSLWIGTLGRSKVRNTHELVQHVALLGVGW